MSILSARTAFWWMVLALLFSFYALFNNFAHQYSAPYWSTGMINALMEFLLQYSWKIGFVMLLLAILISIVLVILHVFYYVRWIVRKLRKYRSPPTDRELMTMLVARMDTQTMRIDVLIGQIQDMMQRYNMSYTRYVARPRYITRRRR